MKKSLFLIPAFIVAVLFTGCEDSNNLFNNSDVSDEGQITIAEEEISNLKSAEATECDESTIGTFAHMLKPGMGSGMGSGMSVYQNFLKDGFPNCVDVTIEGEDFPKTITLNYAEGCEDRHGLARKGIVTIYISDTLTNEGAIYSVSFEDLQVGKRMIDKSATYTNLGVNEDGNQVFSVEQTSTTSFEKDSVSYVIVRDFSGTRTWLAGYDTKYVTDNIFLREGSGSITVNDEYVFTKNITEPILIDRACRFPLSGVVEITRNDEVMEINFGDGECDNLAVVTKDGESEEIELIEGKFRNGFEKAKKNMKKEKGWW